MYARGGIGCQRNGKHQHGGIEMTRIESNSVTSIMAAK